MPIGGKLFKYRNLVDLEQIQHDLNESREAVTLDGYDFISEFEAKYEEEILELVGFYRYDLLHRYPYHGEEVCAPETKIIIYYLWHGEAETYVLIVAPKAIANRTAQKFAEILKPHGDLVEARFSSRVLREYAEAQEKTSIVFFDNLDAINVEKSALYAGEGGNVAQTNLWGDYLNQGTPWYIMGREKSHGYSVGLVRDGSVCIFNNVDARTYYEFVRDEIIDMVLQSHQFN